MPKYKARIVKTIRRVAYVCVEAQDEADAWERAVDALYEITDQDHRWLTVDGDTEVTDIELEEKEIIHATAR